MQRLTGTLAVCAMAAVLGAAAAGAGEAGTARGATGAGAARTALHRPAEQKVSLLYVLTATGGTVTRNTAGKATLRLTGVSRQATMFGDRPSRIVEPLAVSLLVESWQGYGFLADPPNAALTLANGPRGRDTIVLELGRPRWEPRTQVLEIPIKQDATPSENIRHVARKTTGTLPARFRDVSLFIDDATAPVVPAYPPCVLAPGSTCDGVDLSNLDLSGMYLNGITFYEQPVMDKVSFRGAHLAGATFNIMFGPGASNLDFSDVSARGLTFNCSCDIRSSTFAGADLGGARFTANWLSSSDFSNASLADADFDVVKVIGSDFDGVSFVGARIGYNFQGTFTGDSFQGADFTGATRAGSVPFVCTSTGSGSWSC